VTATVLVGDERREAGGIIRQITISNPEKRNALTRGMLADLIEAIPRADEDVRAVILRGDPEGRAFSAGFDINAIDASERARGLDPIRLPADALETCPVPTIACVERAAFGGGVEIALSCTLRVAAPDVEIGMPPARLGLLYSTTGLQRFQRALTPSQMQRLFLTAERIDGEEAARIGLVDVVAKGALEQARRWAEEIASNAPLAVQGTLDAIRRLNRVGGPSPRDLGLIDAARDKTLHSDDLQEAVAAFREKRAPVFRGK
jgi:enoyl-CoA hydratase/carnithine racemase